MLSFLSHATQASESQNRPRRPLLMETLEDRLAPALSIFTNASFPLNIVDNTTVTSVLNVPNSFSIGDVNVQLDLDHTADGELSVSLVAPDLTEVVLFNGVGGAGDNFRNTILDDESGTSIAQGIAPFAGSFEPQGALSDFDGINAQGQWQLKITDNALGNQGFLNNWSLFFVDLDSESELNNSLGTADDIDSNQVVAGTIPAGNDVDVFRVTLAQSGRLVSQVAPSAGSTLDPRLRLLTQQGQELVRSDDQNTNSASARIDQHLDAGIYFLEVTPQVNSGVGSTGGYQLQTGFDPASPPLDPQSILAGSRPTGTLLVDLNNDGNLDVVTVNSGALTGPVNGDTVSVLLGNGDGSFQAERRISVGGEPVKVVAADVNGDDRLDLLTANRDSQDVSLFLGNGNGTFQNEIRITQVGAGQVTAPTSIAVGDLNKDGLVDLIVPRTLRGVDLFLGNGDGTFQNPINAPGAVSSNDVIVRDVNADGNPDVLTIEFNILSDNTLTVRLGNGDGTVQAAQTFVTGSKPERVLVADVNNDLKVDVLTVNDFGRDISLLLGNGDGTFQPLISVKVGERPKDLSVVDVNQDGNLDLLAANTGSGSISVLLGNGDATFQPDQRFSTETFPGSIASGDINNDGKLDVVTGNLTDSVSVLIGNGDGSFLGSQRSAVGEFPEALVVADVNGDGRPDLVVANRNTNDVSILISNGDGSFQPQRRFAVGARPESVAVADLNGDGRPDVVTTNLNDDDVSILLGNGDGTFQVQLRAPVDDAPIKVAIADLDGDGNLDLVTSNVTNFSPELSILLGNGDGTFQPKQSLGRQGSSETLEIRDLNNDTLPDIVSIDRGNRQVVTFLNQTNGAGLAFAAPTLNNVGQFPDSLVLVDLDKQNGPDVVILDGFPERVTILLNQGDGTFQPGTSTVVGGGASSDATGLAVADVNGDANADVLVLESFLTSQVQVLLGDGDGTLQNPTPLSVGQNPSDIAIADVNGDLNPDIITSNRDNGEAGIRFGNGDGTFVEIIDGLSVDFRNSPLRADFDNDGTADLAVLKDSGEILLRRGIPNKNNVFAAPEILNPGRPGRDLALIRTNTGPALAVTEIANQNVSIFAFDGTNFVRSDAFGTARFPQRIGSADLNGDNLDDLVVSSTRDNSVQISLQQNDGTFGAPQTVSVGVTPSDITFADLDGVNGLDVIVTNRVSGDVFLLFNDGTGAFNSSSRYRADIGLSGVQVIDGITQPQSQTDPVSVVAGLFNGDAQTDLVVVNRGSRQFTVIAGTSGAGLTNPQESLRFSTSDGTRLNERPGQILRADFDEDGNQDVLILMQDRGEAWLYQGQGDGTFTLLTTVSVGNAPTGMSIDDVNNDDNLDLLIGNAFGDVLFILGNGDGTFAPFVRADQSVPFVATDLNGDGTLDVVLANAAQDLASGQVRVAGTANFTPGAFQRDANNGLIGPGDVLEADFDGINGTDLVFANSGSNNVLLYLRQADGSFADTPISFFAGTNPVGLNAAQLNDDNNDNVIDNNDFLDLAVANQGSNDISVLLASRGTDVNRDGNIDGNDTFRLGPRLQSGGSGPNAVAANDVDNDGIPDLLATNGQDGTLATIPGVGGGLFNDNGLAPVAIAQDAIVQTQVVNANLGFALTQGGQIRSFNPSTGVATTAFNSVAGREVNAIQAVGTTVSNFMTLFTANRDGSASLLTTQNGVAFAEQVSVTDLSLGNPSALQVLETNAGRFDIYLTDSGESQPVVLTLTVGTDVAVVGSPFAVAVTLFTGLPSTAAAGIDSVGLAQIFNPLFIGQDSVVNLDDVLNLSDLDDSDVILPAGAALLGDLTELLEGGTTEVSLEEEEEVRNGSEEPEPEESPSLNQFVTGMQEALDQLRAEEPGKKLSSDKGEKEDEDNSENENAPSGSSATPEGGEEEEQPMQSKGDLLLPELRMERHTLTENARHEAFTTTLHQDSEELRFVLDEKFLGSVTLFTWWTATTLTGSKPRGRRPQRR